jgi:hypothetical protein
VVVQIHRLLAAIAQSSYAAMVSQSTCQTGPLRCVVDAVDAGYAGCHSGFGPAAVAASGGHDCDCARRDSAGSHGHWDLAAGEGPGGTQRSHRGRSGRDHGVREEGEHARADAGEAGRVEFQVAQLAVGGSDKESDLISAGASSSRSPCLKLQLGP